MHPEICSLGPFTLHSYGLLIALGVSVSLFLMTQKARESGFPPSEKVFDLVFVMVLAGFFGARIFYVIQEWSWYRGHPFEAIQIWKGGLVYYGGMIASFLACFLYARWARLPFLAVSDFLIPYIALTHAFGRVGCFLNGCCYGKATQLPWAVRFPFLPDRVHPTQLYESLFNLSVFAFLAWFYPRQRARGETTALYLVVYPTGRFFLEFFRGDQSPWLFSLTFHQGLSLVFILLGFSLYGICRSRA